MPRKKSSVQRRVERTLDQAISKREALDVIDEVREKVDAEAETEGLHEGEPGTIRAGQKVSFTYAGLCKQFPIVTFTPEETILLTFQGVPFQAYAGIECHVPQCFKEIYDRHRRPANVGRELANLGIKVDAGAGGLGT